MPTQLSLLPSTVRQSEQNPSFLQLETLKLELVDICLLEKKHGTVFESSLERENIKKKERNEINWAALIL